MTFYYAKNESNQYLSSNLLWEDKFDPEKTHLASSQAALLVFAKYAGNYNSCSITSEALADLHRQTPMKDHRLDALKTIVGDVKSIDPSRYTEFSKALAELKERFKMPFQPNATYNPVGDRLEITLAEVPSYTAEPITPNIVVLRNPENGVVIGARLTGVLSVMSTGEVQVIPVSFELAKSFFRLMDFKRSQDPTWAFTPSEIDFINLNVRHWPVLKQLFPWSDQLPQGNESR